MQYLPVIKALRGQAAALEIGDVSRPAVEAVTGIIWDVFYNDTILLLVMFTDRSVEKPQPPPAKDQPTPPKSYETVREFQFKWIRVANILSVVTDANVMVNRQQRQLKRVKNEPLYTDELEHWQKLNNHICRHVINRLKDMKLEGEFGGAFRNAQNDPITFAEAFEPPTTGVSLGPVVPIPPAAPEAVPAPSTGV